MSKLKARLGNAVAGDLGIELSSDSTTLKEIAENPDSVDSLVFVYTLGDDICYDQVPVWRYINGMRIKIPKFHSRPIIEARLAKRLYQGYYVVFDRKLVKLKISKPSELKTRLLFNINDDGVYRSTIVTPEIVMGLRKKPLLFNRQQIKYES